MTQENEVLAAAKRRVEWYAGLLRDLKEVGKTPSAQTKREYANAKRHLADLESQR